jgi:hypothetical protein
MFYGGRREDAAGRHGIVQRGELIIQEMDYHGSGMSVSYPFVAWEPLGVTEQGRNSSATNRPVPRKMYDELNYEPWPRLKVLQAGGMRSDEIVAVLTAEELARGKDRVTRLRELQARGMSSGAIVAVLKAEEQCDQDYWDGYCDDRRDDDSFEAYALDMQQRDSHSLSKPASAAAATTTAAATTVSS